MTDLTALLDGFEQYASPDWDGYDADPITTETLQAAHDFLLVMPFTLGMPHVSPGSDGTVGLEWVFKDQRLRKLFIDIGPGDVWQAYWRKDTNEHQTIPIRPIGPNTATELTLLFKGLET